jgi:hypothetical protein
MSNLTDLLPAGAGGKQVDFVASGTIGNGVTVILNSNGTVSVVGETPVAEVVGSQEIFATNIVVQNVASFDSVNNKVIVSFANYTNSYYGTSIVGTVSGTSISFGTPTVFSSVNCSFLSSAYDENTGKTVISFVNNNQTRGDAVVGTVSGTGISFGTPVFFINASTSYTACAYDKASQKIVIAYTASDSKGYAVVGTVTGTSISFGTRVLFLNESTNWSSIAYSSIAQKVIIAGSGNTSGGIAIVGTVSGTSISFGTPAIFKSGGFTALYNSIVYDTSNDKIVIAFRNDTNTQGQAVVGTVSGTSISFGTAVSFETSATTWINATYDENAGRTVFGFNASFLGQVVVGAVSGTSITFGSKTTVESASSAYFAGAYDSANKKVVVAYQNGSSRGRANVVQPAYNATNNTSFIGISDSAISDTATGSVTIKGGISTNVTGLTPNTDYYVQADGTLSTTTSSVLAGKALSATSINLDYTT